MKIIDKRVLAGTGYTDLGKFIDSNLSLSGGANIEMSMGYEVFVEADELEYLINILERIEAIRDGKLNE